MIFDSSTLTSQIPPAEFLQFMCDLSACQKNDTIAQQAEFITDFNNELRVANKKEPRLSSKPH